jgi:tetratricopeptide (TPR) repeat protein
VLFFFYVAILPSSRIISDSALPPLLLDRMLYLPAVGLVICLSSAFFWLARARSLRSSALVGALVVLSFLPVTWARNDAWGNELELLEHDLFHEPRNRQLLSSLIKAHAREGQAARSMRLCEQFTDAVNETLVLSHDCAMIYAAAGLQKRAEEFFLHALALDPGSAWDHFELARLYVRMEKRDLATSHFRSAIQNENLSFIREIMRAIMLIELYPGDPGRLVEAKNHLERALQLQPRSVHARELLDQLNRRP